MALRMELCHEAVLFSNVEPDSWRLTAVSYWYISFMAIKEKPSPLYQSQQLCQNTRNGFFCYGDGIVICPALGESVAHNVGDVTRPDTEGPECGAEAASAEHGEDPGVDFFRGMTAEGSKEFIIAGNGVFVVFEETSHRERHRRAVGNAEFFCNWIGHGMAYGGSRIAEGKASVETCFSDDFPERPIFWMGNETGEMGTDEADGEEGKLLGHFACVPGPERFGGVRHGVKRGRYGETFGAGQRTCRVHHRVGCEIFRMGAGHLAFFFPIPHGRPRRCF